MNPPAAPQAVCHVLLCHLDDGGLALVDTGLGLEDYSNPGRMGPVRHLMRPNVDPALTALRQVEALGFGAADVRHIVMTHLDFDHVGGMSDFPEATVHTTADEHAAAITAPDLLDRVRYRKPQFAYGPRFELHAGPGDEWRDGLTGHEVLPGITLVPMPGHSRGHAAVAVDAGDRGLIVHAGDAIFDASQYTDTSPSGEELGPVKFMRAFEKIVGRDRKAIARNHETLRRLHGEDGVTVVNAHDARILAALQS